MLLFRGKEDEPTLDADAPLTLCDARGYSDPTSLGIPGPRYLRAGRSTADHARLVTADAERHAARDEMIVHLRDEWRVADTPPGSYPYTAAKEGTACTVNGQPGVLVKEGDALVCRPIAPGQHRCA